MIPPHPWGLFFKVQSANVVSRCDKFYYLGPVVKPRDDKFLSFFILRFFLYRHPGAGRDPLHRRYLCRIRDGINYLGPVVKPRDDTREQSSKCKVQSANVVSRCDKSYDLGPGVKHRDDTREQSSKCKEQSSNVVSRCDGINYLGPVVKPRDDKK